MSLTLPVVTTTDMNPDADLGSRLVSFLYTPYGVATLAAISIIITSLVWTLGCMIYCCCKYKRHESGVAEANREMLFFGNMGPASNGHGTMSSGYNTGPQSYTTNSYNMTRNGSTAMLNVSLDSMLDHTAY